MKTFKTLNIEHVQRKVYKNSNSDWIESINEMNVTGCIANSKVVTGGILRFIQLWCAMTSIMERKAPKKGNSNIFCV